MYKLFLGDQYHYVRYRPRWILPIAFWGGKAQKRRFQTWRTSQVKGTKRKGSGRDAWLLVSLSAVGGVLATRSSIQQRNRLSPAASPPEPSQMESRYVKRAL
jgi:hypothetical protein